MGPPNWGNDDSSLLGVEHEEETTQHNKKEQHIYRLTSPILIALQASAKQHSTLANPALYRDNIDVYSCATNITAKILAGSEEASEEYRLNTPNHSAVKNKFAYNDPSHGVPEFALVEVWLLRVRAARALDDDIGSVATGPHAVFDALALDQLREEASNEGVTCRTPRLLVRSGR